MARTRRNTRPILITGANRSGTTWLATMLAGARGTLQIYEPFSMRPNAYRLGGLAKNWHEYAPGLDQAASLQAFQRVLDGKTRKVFRRRQIQYFVPFTRRGRPIIKDPVGCFSAEWIANHFGAQVVVLVRHPGAYAASLKRMNWRFDFQNLLRQERLMQDWLAPYRADMQAQPDEIVDQAALLWTVIYHVLLGCAERNPDWIVRTHDSLSSEPIARIRGLCDELDLPWSARLEERIHAYTTGENPVDPQEGVAHSMMRNSIANVARWKNLLSAQEIQRLRAVTGALAARVYAEESW